MYKITRPGNDGRTSFAGIKFFGEDFILTDSEDVCRMARDIGWAVEEAEEFKCDVCGKVCKNELGLNAHKRSHKEE
jgi:hypothetical protein